MADRQTALAVFDFLDSLRAGQYRIGADAEKDHATAGLLASLSGDTGRRVREADIAGPGARPFPHGRRA